MVGVLLGQLVCLGRRGRFVGLGLWARKRKRRSLRGECVGGLSCCGGLLG